MKSFTQFNEKKESPGQKIVDGFLAKGVNADELLKAWENGKEKDAKSILKKNKVKDKDIKTAIKYMFEK